MKQKMIEGIVRRQMIIKYAGIGIVVLLLLLLLLVYVGVFNRFLPPPISVSYRTSLLAPPTKVLQVHNDSDSKILFCTLHIENTRTRQKREINFSLGPHEIKEFGLVELNWVFEPGEVGHITAKGYGYYRLRVP